MPPSLKVASTKGVSIERVSPVQIAYATFCKMSQTPKSRSSETIGSCSRTRLTASQALEGRSLFTRLVVANPRKQSEVFVY